MWELCEAQKVNVHWDCRDRPARVRVDTPSTTHPV